MKRYLIALCILAFISCKNEPKEIDTDKIVVNDSIESPTMGKVVVKDASLYGEPFIESLNKMNYKEDIILDGEYIIVGKDTAQFPDDLVLGEDYRFTAFTDTHFYQLAVKRINQSSIQYDYQVFKDEKPLVSSTGEAHLAGLFFLGSETDDDDQTGAGYLSTEYFGVGECSSTIRIGEPDGASRLRAVVRTSCDGYEAVDGNITLRESK